jgi:hypothetical protein
MINDPARGYSWLVPVGGYGYYFQYPFKSAFTISFWIKWYTVGTTSNQLSLGIGPNTSTYALYVSFYNTTGNSQVGWYGNSGGGIQIGGASVVNNVNPNWLMITVTFNGTTETAYVNGIMLSGTASNFSFSSNNPLNTTAYVTVGTQTPSTPLGAGFSACLVNSVYVWDQVLTPAQINLVYTNT